MSDTPLSAWGWLCLAGIIAIFGLMALQEREPHAYLVAALVTVAGFILRISLPGPWGGPKP